MKKLTILIGLITQLSFAGFKPNFVYQTDPYFGHHIIVAEKSSHTLYVYEQDNGFIKLINKYPMATGEIPGDKSVQGDKKTPEGIYITSEFLSSTELLKKYGEYGKMYGAGAFTLSYPNPYDLLQGKTGSGIWLHSTDDESRISKQLDSKGCVVVNDKHLSEISKYIDLKNTVFVISDEVTYLKEETWNKNKQSFLSLVNDWKDAWNKGDFKNYIKHYSPWFNDRSRGNLTEFSAYKKNIFKANLGQSVNFDHISIFSHEDYALIVMRQDYKSNTINDVGRKVLHLVRDKRYRWKIIRELWYSLNIQGELKFAGSKDFFNLSQAQ